MSNKKKIAATAGACGLAGAMLIGGTMAYLTDEEQTTNRFTVGKVHIDLEEPNYPGNGSDKVTSILPNEEIPKDPQIRNTGKNNTIVFMAFDSPKANVVIANQDGSIPSKYKLKETMDPEDNIGFPEGDAEGKRRFVINDSEKRYEPQMDEIFSYSKNVYNEAEAKSADGKSVGGFNSVYGVDKEAADADIIHDDPKSWQQIGVKEDIIKDKDGHEVTKGEGDTYTATWMDRDNYKHTRTYTATGRVDEEGRALYAVSEKKMAPKTNNDGGTATEEVNLGADYQTTMFEYVRRVYGYRKVVAPTEATKPLFNTVKLNNVVEGNIDDSQREIVIYSYAIQADNVNGLTGEDFNPSTAMTEEKLKGIYDVYVNQSYTGDGKQTPADADGRSELTLGEAGKQSIVNIQTEIKDTHLELHTSVVGADRSTAVATLGYTGNGSVPKITISSADTGKVMFLDKDGNEVSELKDIAVDVDGHYFFTVVGKAEGTSKITATVEDPQSKQKATAVVTVTVQDMSPAATTTPVAPTNP